MKIFLITALVFAVNASADVHCEKKYKRSYFKHWIDEDRNCFNTRQEVLIKDSISHITTQDCKVLRGEWYDVYSGEIFTNPRTLDIDHLIPLKEAWDSGACNWDGKTRTAFANDFDNLLAVKNILNRQKGAKDPAEWMPPRKEYHCEYIATWVYIKKKYNLEMDSQERQKIKEINRECQ